MCFSAHSTVAASRRTKMQAAAIAAKPGVPAQRRRVSAQATRPTPATPARGCRAPRRPLAATPRAAKEEEAIQGLACSIDDMGACNLAQLETMYVDALWNFYNGGKFTLSNEQYDSLKDELNWQGSGFPTLRREEIKFVQASIEFAKGNKIMEDAEYEKLKESIKSTTGKRADVTALLLTVKGQQMLSAEEYERLKQDMINLGIDFGRKDASCTLSETPESLETDFESLFVMYGGLSALPFLGASVAWLLINTILPIDLPLSSYVVFVGGVTVALVATIMNVAELSNGKIVKGQCPCCETSINAFFKADSPVSMERKCQVCGTGITLNSSTMKLKLSDGPKYLS